MGSARQTGNASLHGIASNYVQSCFAAESPPRVKELAEVLGTTVPRLSRAFGAETGVSLSVFLRQAQIRRAQLLLARTGFSMNQVAYRAGFVTRMTFFCA